MVCSHCYSRNHRITGCRAGLEARIERLVRELDMILRKQFVPGQKGAGKNEPCVQVRLEKARRALAKLMLSP
jgi:hypothetical protein